MHRERRKQERVSEESYVGVQRVTSPDKPQELDSIMCGLMRDFSMGGMRIETSHDYDIGADLKITTWVRSRTGMPDPITHVGRVRWKQQDTEKSYLVGIKLVGTTRSHQPKWDQYVQEQITRNDSE